VANHALVTCVPIAQMMCCAQMDGPHPTRTRLLDLPFTAVEWVQPPGSLTTPLSCVDDVAVWRQAQGGQQQGQQQQHQQQGQQQEQGGARSSSEEPEERLAFTLGDGRAGVCACEAKCHQKGPCKRSIHLHG